MPDNDAAAEKFAYEKTFIELIDASETRDFGISLFEKTMDSVAQKLTTQYKGTSLVSLSELDDYQESLNDEWRYHNDIATVSGRIYIYDSDIVDDFSEQWGEAQTDEHDDAYFFVENIQLRSQGIELIPETDDNGITTEVRAVFSFAEEDDEEEIPLFYARMGELSQHTYADLTPEEAQLRMERLWPQEYKLTTSLLRPDLQMALPRRLAMLTNKFQIPLRDSLKFRDYLSKVVESNIELDNEYPYAVQVQGRLFAFDGEDPHDPDDPGFWIELVTEEPLAIVAHQPEIWFSEDDDLTVKAYFLMRTFSREHSYPEYVRVEAKDVIGFRSSRAERSLVSRALGSIVGERVVSDRADAAYSEAATRQDEAAVAIVPEVSRLDTEPQHITELRFLENTYKEVAKIIQDHQKTYYDSEAVAHEAAIDLLTDGGVQNVLAGGGLLNTNHLHLCSGETIVMPNADPEIAKLKLPQHILAVGLDQENPGRPMAKGDILSGYVRAIVPSVRSVTRQDGKVVYQVNPGMVVSTGNKEFGFNVWYSSPAINVQVETRMFVPLDGSAEIQLAALEQYREAHGALTAAKAAYGKNAGVVKSLNLITATLAHEITEGMQVFKPLQHVQAFDQVLAREVEKGRPMEPAVKSLEALFLYKVIEVKGYGYGQEHSYNLDDKLDELSEIEYLGGTVIDVRKESPEDATVFVIESTDGGIFYVPLRHISALQF